MIQCNGVFEGGGVRGIGHVGAICGMEQAGYQFVDLAGSSAGAIVAALLAAGYSCQELKKELEALDYEKLKGTDLIDYFGMAGKAISIFLSLGIYNTNYLEQWVDELLCRKQMRQFGDIKRSGRKLKITASDLTEQRLLIFPDDLEKFGLEADAFRIASAVRMSASIPIFFEPVRLKDQLGKEHLIVDGGLLSNYPIWILDDGESIPKRPTFGFRFVDEKAVPCNSITNTQLCIADYLKAIVATCMDAIDNSRLEVGDYERTIQIPTTIGTGSEKHKIRTVDFDISKSDSQALFENGRIAAQRFLRTWDFHQWKRKYRK